MVLAADGVSARPVLDEVSRSPASRRFVRQLETASGGGATRLLGVWRVSSAVVSHRTEFGKCARGLDTTRSACN